MRKYVTILEMRTNAIALVQAEITSNGAEITHLDDIVINDASLPETDDGEKRYCDALRGLSTRYAIAKTDLISIIPRYQVFMRTVKVPPATDEEVRNMLGFEAEKYLPFPVEKAVIDFYRFGAPGATGATEIMLVAAKREIVEKHLAVLNQAGLFPDWVTITSMGVERLFSGVCENSIVLKIDEDSFETDIFLEGKLQLSRGLALPAHNKKAEHVALIERELHNSCDAVRGLHVIPSVQNVYYLGDNEAVINRLAADGITSLQKADIRKSLGTRAIPASASESQLSRCAVPIGVALSSRNVINLIPRDIQTTRTSDRKMKVNVIAAVTAAGLLLLFAGIYSVVGYRNFSASREKIQHIKLLEPEIRELRVIDQKLGLVADFTAGNLYPLEIIEELSALLPANAYIRQLHYDEDQKKLSLLGRTDSYTSASLIASRIATSACFTQVINKGAHTMKSGNISLVDFEIDCVLKPHTNRSFNEAHEEI